MKSFLHYACIYDCVSGGPKKFMKATLRTHPVQWLFNLFGIKFFFFLCKTRQMFSISIALLVHFRFAVYASI